MTEGTNTKYMLTDVLGSVTGVYNATTGTTAFTTYDVYGNSETIPASPYGYAGMRYAGVGLYITPNRAYSPRLGRWLQSDPLGTTPNPQTGNVYSPLNGRDVWGLVCGHGNIGDFLIVDNWKNVSFFSACTAHDHCYEANNGLTYTPYNLPLAFMSIIRGGLCLHYYL